MTIWDLLFIIKNTKSGSYDFETGILTIEPKYPVRYITLTFGIDIKEK